MFTGPSTGSMLGGFRKWEGVAPPYFAWNFGPKKAKAKGMAESPGPQSPSPAPHSWPRTTMWVGIVLILAGAGVLALRSCQKMPGEAIDKTGQLIKQAGQAAANVAKAFKEGTITMSFLSYATSVSNTHYLQFATLKQTEVFTRKDEASTAFGYIPLPDVIVEARAPVECSYYLDLNAKWQFLVKDNVLYVMAPPIRFNKPAVDASEITYEVKVGSKIRDTAKAMDNLKKSITSQSIMRSRENIALVRENGRRQTTEFVEKWLMKSFTDGKEYPVKVYFPGEKPPGDLTVPARPLN